VSKLVKINEKICMWHYMFNNEFHKALVFEFSLWGRRDQILWS